MDHRKLHSSTVTATSTNRITGAGSQNTHFGGSKVSQIANKFQSGGGGGVKITTSSTIVGKNNENIFTKERSPPVLIPLKSSSSSSITRSSSSDRANIQQQQPATRNENVSTSCGNDGGGGNLLTSSNRSGTNSSSNNSNSSSNVITSSTRFSSTRAMFEKLGGSTGSNINSSSSSQSPPDFKPSVLKFNNRPTTLGSRTRSFDNSNFSTNNSSSHSAMEQKTTVRKMDDPAPPVYVRSSSSSGNESGITGNNNDKTPQKTWVTLDKISSTPPSSTQLNTTTTVSSSGGGGGGVTSPSKVNGRELIEKQKNWMSHFNKIKSPPSENANRKFAAGIIGSNNNKSPQTSEGETGKNVDESIHSPNNGCSSTKTAAANASPATSQFLTGFEKFNSAISSRSVLASNSNKVEDNNSKKLPMTPPGKIFSSATSNLASSPPKQESVVVESKTTSKLVEKDKKVEIENHTQNGHHHYDLVEESIPVTKIETEPSSIKSTISTDNISNKSQQQQQQTQAQNKNIITTTTTPEPEQTSAKYERISDSGSSNSLFKIPSQSHSQESILSETSFDDDEGTTTTTTTTVTAAVTNSTTSESTNTTTTSSSDQAVTIIDTIGERVAVQQHSQLTSSSAGSSISSLNTTTLKGNDSIDSAGGGGSGMLISSSKYSTSLGDDSFKQDFGKVGNLVINPVANLNNIINSSQNTLDDDDGDDLIVDEEDDEAQTTVEIGENEDDEEFCGLEEIEIQIHQKVVKNLNEKEVVDDGKVVVSDEAETKSCEIIPNVVKEEKEAKVVDDDIKKTNPSTNRHRVAITSVLKKSPGESSKSSPADTKAATFAETVGVEAREEGEILDGDDDAGEGAEGTANYENDDDDHDYSWLPGIPPIEDEEGDESDDHVVEDDAVEADQQEKDENGAPVKKKRTRLIRWSTDPIKVCRTYSVEEYDRKNEDIDPTGSAAEYELEKRIEKMDVLNIELFKGSDGLGLSIIGMGVGADSGLEKLGIFIKSVCGIAKQDGRIQVNDQIISVDGQNLVGVTQAYAASVLRNTSGLVKFVIGREKENSENSEVAQLIRQSIEADKEREKKLFRPLPPPPPPPQSTSITSNGSNSSPPNNQSNAIIESLKSRLEDEITKSLDAEKQIEELKQLILEEKKMNEIKLLEYENNIKQNQLEMINCQCTVEESRGEYAELKKKYTRIKGFVRTLKNKEKEMENHLKNYYEVIYTLQQKIHELESELRICGIPHKHEKSTLFIPSPLSLMPNTANTLGLDVSSNEEECDEDRMRAAAAAAASGSKQDENVGPEKAKEEFDSLIPPKSSYLLDVSIEKSKAQLLTQKRHSSQMLKSSSMEEQEKSTFSSEEEYLRASEEEKLFIQLYSPDVSPMKPSGDEINTDDLLQVGFHNNTPQYSSGLSNSSRNYYFSPAYSSSQQTLQQQQQQQHHSSNAVTTKQQLKQQEMDWLRSQTSNQYFQKESTTSYSSSQSGSSKHNSPSVTDAQLASSKVLQQQQQHRQHSSFHSTPTSASMSSTSTTNYSPFMATKTQEPASSHHQPQPKSPPRIIDSSSQQQQTQQPQPPPRTVRPPMVQHTTVHESINSSNKNNNTQLINSMTSSSSFPQQVRPTHHLHQQQQYSSTMQHSSKESTNATTEAQRSPHYHTTTTPPVPPAFQAQPGSVSHLIPAESPVWKPQQTNAQHSQMFYTSPTQHAQAFKAASSSVIDKVSSSSNSSNSTVINPSSLPANTIPMMSNKNSKSATVGDNNLKNSTNKKPTSMVGSISTSPKWMNINPIDWSNEQVCDWLTFMNMDHLIPPFQDHSITGAQLINMESKDLKRFGVSGEDKLKIKKKIKEIKSDVKKQEKKDAASTVTNAGSNNSLKFKLFKK